MMTQVSVSAFVYHRCQSPLPDAEWDWPEKCRKAWIRETGKPQEFYDYWRNRATGSEFSDKFPYELRQRLPPFVIPLSSDNTYENTILITKSYEDIFRRLLFLRQEDEGDFRGAVLTGQPGTGESWIKSMTRSPLHVTAYRRIRSPGKTTFLKFMLVRLISAHQVVLVCGSTIAFLFYCGEVYSRSTSSGLEGLPKHRHEGYHPVWGLVDVDYQTGGPPISEMSNIWPIQASSPKSDRWKAWSKQSGASMIGMPRWSTKDLIRGFVFSLFPLFANDSTMPSERNSLLIVLFLFSSLPLRSGYRKFRDNLKTFLPLGSTPLTADNGNIRAALEVLRTTSEGRGLVAAEGGDETDYAGEPRVVAEAFEILVRNAIEMFGFAPRDVYVGVLRLPHVALVHTNAVEGLKWEVLKDTVTTFSHEQSLGSSSHRVVAVYPLPEQSVPSYDRWSIDFKSNEVARQVIFKMEEEEMTHLQEMFHSFHDIPESSTLAGRWFETIAHRVLSKGWLLGDPTPEPIPMGSYRPTEDVPPVFSTTTPSTPRPLPPAPVRTVRRITTLVDFARGLSEVTLDSNKYYRPTAGNLPLFDSLAIDLDPGRDVLVISFFQMTISPSHAGSAEGYKLIREIMAHVTELLEEAHSTATVEVVYFLVCPAKRSVRRWQMPPTWDEKTSYYDHRGSVFCIMLPV